MAAAEAAIAAAEKSLRGLQGATPTQLGRIRRMVRRLERLLEALLVFRQDLARMTSLVDDAMGNYTRQPGQPSSTPDADTSGTSVDLHG